MTLNIANTIQTIQEIITGDSYTNSQSQLQALVSNPNITITEANLNTIVLGYFNFLHASLAALVKASLPSDYITAVGDYTTNIQNNCNTINTVVNLSKTSGSIFSSITTSDLLIVDENCNVLFNYYDSIFQAATALQTSQNSTSVPTVANTLSTTSVTNLAGYKSQLQDAYTQLALGSDYTTNPMFAAANIAQFPNINSYLQTRLALKADLDPILAINFSPSNISQIAAVITPTAISDATTLYAQLQNISTTPTSYGLTTLYQDNGNIPAAANILSILNTLLSLASQATTSSASNVTPTTTSNIPNISTSTTPTATASSTASTSIPGVSSNPNTAASWGVKFTVANPNFGQVATGSSGPSLATGNYYMSLLPAMNSTIPMQGGRDVPNAMPGLNIKVIPSVAKHKIPGFQPVFQNLGMNQMVITLIGCFTGADGAVDQSKIVNTGTTGDITDNLATFPGSYTTVGSSNAPTPLLTTIDAAVANLNSYNSFQEFYNLTIRQGKQVSIEINLLKTYQGNLTAFSQYSSTKMQSSNGNPSFTTVVRNIEVYHRGKDRTWYTLQLEVVDFGLASTTPINLNNKLDQQIAAAQAAAASIPPSVSAPTDPTVNAAFPNIYQRIQALTDPTNRQQQTTLYLYMIQYISNIRNASNNKLNLYSGYQGSNLFSDWVTSLTSYSDAQFIPIPYNSNTAILLRGRLNCPTIGQCQSEKYFLLDTNPSATQIITKFQGNGIQEIGGAYLNPLNPLAGIVTFQQDLGDLPQLDGTSDQLNSLTAIAERITPVEWGTIIVKGLGCIGGIVAAGGIEVSTAGIGTGVAGAVALAGCTLNIGLNISSAQDTLNQNDDQWNGAVAADIGISLLIDFLPGGLSYVSSNTGIGTAISGVVSNTTGNLLTQGGTIANTLDNLSGNFINLLGGEINTAASSTSSSIASDLLTNLQSLSDPQALVGQTITVGNNPVTVTSVVSTTADPYGFFVKTVNSTGDTAVTTLNEIQSVSPDLFNLPTSTTISTSTINPIVSSTQTFTPLVATPVSSVQEATNLLNNIGSAVGTNDLSGMIIQTSSGSTYQIKTLGAVTTNSSGVPVVNFVTTLDNTGSIPVGNIKSITPPDLSTIITTPNITTPIIPTISTPITQVAASASIFDSIPTNILSSDVKTVVETLDQASQNNLGTIANAVNSNQQSNLLITLNDGSVLTNLNNISISKEGNGIELLVQNSSNVWDLDAVNLSDIKSISSTPITTNTGVTNTIPTNQVRP